MRILLISALLTLIAPLALGATYNVPGNFNTIQAAINASANGDVIQVAPGTYKENLDFMGKAITVRSTQGPYRTTLNADSQGSGALFINGEKSNTVFKGFRIINGTGTDDSGNYVGGGIYLANNSAPKLRDLIIEGCQADKGGAVFCDTGNLSMENVQILGNSAVVAGGGIFLSGATAMFEDCRIHGNTATGADGGGIYCYNTMTFSAENTVITDNASAFWGGALASLFGGDFSFVNSVIAGNSAEVSGGGVGLFYGGSLSLLNVTMYKNSANTGLGGGLFLSGIATPTQSLITNSLLYGNTAPNGPAAAIDGADLEITYSDVEGGQASVDVGLGVLTYGSGNIDQAPVFFDETNHDYHLLAGSGGIDAGDNGAAGLTVLDFEDDLRVNGTVDMGADEYYRTYMYFTDLTKTGEAFKMNLMGQGNAAPVVVFIGSGVLLPPLNTPYGDLVPWISGEGREHFPHARIGVREL